ncbi:D-alanyl-D-alanine carboxypeptidase [Limosilactobacillus sp. RRLNB_1_1]|uniref:serine-type D-Ala-D-Ala carboxypeptidase n=1 Tax=Limosilactobacillus albertensis TaxID=2759752 RepID=A0A7W3TSD6_9LACO|nr:D-alanyl-D-alanine carboxypeptidase family protein [Limosilactobacillus albertensis]MBB1070040.1 D-alanyl-D-alanine carboxypeptidase [Limosilactobacillus albertensis]MCD7117277.1 D-alanyl-D-alanine carboxypeptidase [Limosilactobacillus albertensis]MCD7128881.1 D-alanyl-D-alanine carboxypeptidase [Limosilactobacillus albertensis]
MKKMIVFILSLFMVLAVGSQPVLASSRIDATAAIMVDASTGQIIYKQNIEKALPVASITKLLTILVIEDEIQQKQISWDTQVKITPEIAAISNDSSYSSIGLKAGQSYSVRTLINAALVKSADGATVALATATGDGTDEFNLKMMQKAKKIGMTHTNIVNSVGLDNGDMKSFKLADLPNNAANTMSARDVAILSQYLIRHYPELLQITAQKEVKFQIAKDQVKTEKNLNKMLPGEQYTVKGVTIDGLKTGTSDSAGACFASTGKYRGHRIITVILHSKGDNKDNRFKTTQDLYNILKSEYHLQKIKVPSSVTTRKVANGAEKTMKLGPQQVTIWSPYDTKTDYTIGTQYKTSQLEAPIWKGEHVGNLRITSDQLETLTGEPLTYSLYSVNDVRRGNFWQRLWH